MPRPDNKRQKQGRPSDPRAAVFQEQFLPQMPGSNQRNVFIQPSAPIVDKPSQISFGNMVPGPDSGLQTLAALAKGVTQGAQAAQQVYKYRVDKGQKDFDKMMQEEDYGKVVYKPTEGPMQIDPETGKPIPRIQEPLLINKNDKEYAELVKDYEDARANGTLDKLEYTILDDPQANYTMLRDKMEAFLDGKPREVRLYADRALEKLDSVAYTADQKDRTKDLIREASAIRSPEDRLAYLEEYEAKHGAIVGTMVGDQLIQLKTQTSHAIDIDNERQIQVKLTDAIDELVGQADANGTLFNLDPTVIDDLIEPIIEEVLGSGDVTQDDLDQLAKLQEIKEAGISRLKRAQRNQLHESQKRARLEGDQRAKKAYGDLTPDLKFKRLPEELERRRVVREKEGLRINKTMAAAKKAEDILDIFGGMMDQFKSNPQDLIKFAKDNGITGTESMSVDAIIKRVQAIFAAHLKGAKLTPDIREEILQEEVANLQGDINRIISERAASGQDYLSEDSLEELNFLYGELDTIKNNPQEALVRIISAAPSKYNAFRDDFDYQEDQLLSLFSPDVVEDITSGIIRNRQADTLDFAMMAIAEQAEELGYQSLTEYDTDTIQFGPLSPSGLNLEMFDINPELKDAAIEFAEAIRNGTLDEVDANGKTAEERYYEYFADIYPDRGFDSREDPQAAAGLEVAQDVLQQFDQAKVKQNNRTSSARREENKLKENASKWSLESSTFEITGLPVTRGDTAGDRAAQAVSDAWGKNTQETTVALLLADTAFVEEYPLARALFEFNQLPEDQRPKSLTDYFIQYSNDNNIPLSMEDVEAVSVVVDSNIGINGVPQFSDPRIKKSPVAQKMLVGLYARILGQDKVATDSVTLTNPYTNAEETAVFRLSDKFKTRMREDLQQQIGEFAKELPRGLRELNELVELNIRYADIAARAYAEGVVEKARSQAPEGFTPEQEASVRLDAENDYRNGLFFQESEEDNIQSVLGFSDEQVALSRVLYTMVPPGSTISESTKDLIFNATLGNTDFEPSITSGRAVIAGMGEYFENEDYVGGLKYLLRELHEVDDLGRVYKDTNDKGHSQIMTALNAVEVGETENEKAEYLLRSILASGAVAHGRIGTLKRIMSQSFEGGAGQQRIVPPADLIKFLQSSRTLDGGRSLHFTPDGVSYVAGNRPRGYSIDGDHTIPTLAAILFGSRVTAPKSFIGLMATNMDNYSMSSETSSRIENDLDTLLSKDPTLHSMLHDAPPAMLAIWTDMWIAENYGDQVRNAGRLRDAMEIGKNKFMPVEFTDFEISDPTDEVLRDILPPFQTISLRIPNIDDIRSNIMFGRGLDPAKEDEVFSTGDNRDIKFDVASSLERGNEIFTSFDFGSYTYSIPTNNTGTDPQLAFNKESPDLVMTRVDAAIRKTGSLSEDIPTIFMGRDGRRSLDATFLKANPELIPATIQREEVQTARDVVSKLEEIGILKNNSGIYSIVDDSNRSLYLPPNKVNGQRYTQRAALNEIAYYPGIKMQYLRSLETPEEEEVEVLIKTYGDVIPDRGNMLVPNFIRSRDLEFTELAALPSPAGRDVLDTRQVPFSRPLQRPTFTVTTGNEDENGYIRRISFQEGELGAQLKKSLSEVTDIARRLGGFPERNVVEIRYSQAEEGDTRNGIQLTMNSYIPYLDMTIREAIDLSRRID